MATELYIPEIHVGDTGTAFVFKLLDLSFTAYDPCTTAAPPAFDVSAATSMEMLFGKPDGTTVTVTAVHSTLTGVGTTGPGDGTDGFIEYRTLSGFLDQAGQWSRQAKVTTPEGTWSSSIARFTVHPNVA